MAYRMPRAGNVTGYTVTGSANRSPYGAFVTVRALVTGQVTIGVAIDPSSQPGYNLDEGTQVEFTTPLRVAKGDTVCLKFKIKDGNFGQVDLTAFLQITLDAATSS